MASVNHGGVNTSGARIRDESETRPRGGGCVRRARFFRPLTPPSVKYQLFGLKLKPFSSSSSSYRPPADRIFCRRHLYLLPGLRSAKPYPPVTSRCGGGGGINRSAYDNILLSQSSSRTLFGGTRTGPTTPTASCVRFRTHGIQTDRPTRRRRRRRDKNLIKNLTAYRVSPRNRVRSRYMHMMCVCYTRTSSTHKYII